jgi:putative redox protein
MEAVIQYVGDARFSAEARGHRVLSDQPYENSGTDAGMTPPELLLTSLGTCAGYYAVQYLRAQPARLDPFQITVLAPDVEGRHQDGLMRAIRSCLIHHTLQHQPHIDVQVETGHQGLAQEPTASAWFG